MASTKKSKDTKQTLLVKLKKKVSYIYWTYMNKRFALSLLLDPRKLYISAGFLLLFEIVLNFFIINRVKYTEIDWKAYMQEVEGVINGTYDYSKLKGDTGPLVYPAGFVYIYTALYYLTDNGRDIQLAQYIFIFFYFAMLCCVFRIYIKSKKVPPYAIIISCCTSYRIHSIFVLRLFNDPVAMILLFLSINLFISNYWKLGSFIYSLAVSVKMNVLLFSPALLLAYLCCLGLKETAIQLVICGSVQLILGLPFIFVNPWGYLKGSFDIGRVFLYQWTVNWRFIPEEIFVNLYFHIGLLLLHVILLMVFFRSSKLYLQSYAKLKQIEVDVKPQFRKDEKINMETSSRLFILPMFVANLIGITCSRSLHYQFYVWYFHTLPYLLWCTPFTNVWRLIILGVIELCWNTYPSTIYSSGALLICHLSMLLGIFITTYNEKQHNRGRNKSK